MMMKKLVRIRLINWHYFENETIDVKGSVLISGENTSGKSTILDAIQMVLTTNYRRFNKAANEKSNRNLKGYVRCKTGNEDGAYLRTKSVITYAALEFFEEKTSKYFTIGVKIDSPDLESKLSIKWFLEECKMEELKFITGGRPSTTEEFRRNDRKINLILRSGDARSRFGRRLGGLEERFFEMVQKSLAFKPMDNVKDFINRFILSEKRIEVETLRSNIANLKELEDLMSETKRKISELDAILEKKNDIELQIRDIRVNDVLIKKATIEKQKQDINRAIETIQAFKQKLLFSTSESAQLKSGLTNERKRYTDLQVSLGSNETSRLILSSEHNIEILSKELIFQQHSLKKLEDMLHVFVSAFELLNKFGIVIVSKDELLLLDHAKYDIDKKTNTMATIKNELGNLLESYRSELYRRLEIQNQSNEKKMQLVKEINDLKNKKITYPPNTTKLIEVIQEEFNRLEIASSPRVFSSLLEVTDPLWQNAVEGYLNTQRFYVLVNPKYYELAAEIYNKHKQDIHSVGLINTAKLDRDIDVIDTSLAYFVFSENTWAKAYATFLLNQVTRCSNVSELGNFKTSITPDCMLYKSLALRKINESVYRTPYIGAYAIEIQLKNKEQELLELNRAIAENQVRIKELEALKDAVTLCNSAVIEEHINAPVQVLNTSKAIKKEQIELAKAKDDPNYLALKIQLEECAKEISSLEKKYDEVNTTIGSISNQITSNEQLLSHQKIDLIALENDFQHFCEEDIEVAKAGLIKYEEQIKRLNAFAIVGNFSPRRAGLQNKLDEFKQQLMILQADYRTTNHCDFGTGYDQIQEYVDEHYKLKSSEIVKYESELEKAKEYCHLEFRESFLAKLRENIESARMEFNTLNGALKNIYYGDDSYKFELTFNKSKERIYQMIMSKKNEQGFSLWSDSFSDEFKDEMDDLFSKLTAYDDQGDKVLLEYTDYRSYLDYDIAVQKKDGSLQKFSKIYGEKSGGETQTPYYVAIAASFVQLYKYSDTIRILIFDEAFDKMDDNRISSMMDFLNSQNFQIIIATPPSKLEIIGEKVDTVLMTMREGTTSFVEGYDL